MSNSLKHHGVIGMKWGVRRYQNKDGSLTAAGKKRAKQNVDNDDANETSKTSSASGTAKASPTTSKKTIKELTDAELREKINRLQLEKQYRDLAKSEVQVSKGKAFVSGVLEQSGKNIATQLTTYVMGRGVNALLKDVFNDDAVVNPKKGQKDK